MLDSVPMVFAVSAFLGFLAGLGIGGGSLLILWLTLVLNIEPGIARSINLMFFLPTAIISSFIRWRQGTLDIRSVVPGIIAGCICAAIFSVVSRYIASDILQKLFGILLLAIGIKELMYRPRN